MAGKFGEGDNILVDDETLIIKEMDHHRYIKAVDARNSFSDCISLAKYTGVRLIITRRGQHMAAIVSIEDLEKLTYIDKHYDTIELDEGQDE